VQCIKFSNNLYYKRRLQNLTQKELAEKVGIKRHKISMLEHGHILPTTELLKELARVLDILESDLYSQEELRIILDYKK